MQKKKITYGINGMMTYQAIFHAGASVVKVLFSDGSITASGKKPATFTTDNFMLQHIIEQSKEFKEGFIFRYRTLLLNEKVHLDRNHRATVIPPEHPHDKGDCKHEHGCKEHDKASKDEDRKNPEDEGLMEVEEVSDISPKVFSCNDEAKDWLNEHYDTTNLKMRTRSEIMDSAKILGVEISFE